ncbi:hypothetical protein CEXT_37781 [Caerostris extrusa]|uniref:Ribosomal protein L32 n=1 Tax=Caerostris extrusa TaxID=172846 RepID=A0AAV4V501_CAEEX|nr:hypothetical protein CEXT_37781 [Caerostris extrusa]
MPNLLPANPYTKTCLLKRSTPQNKSLKTDKKNFRMRTTQSKAMLKPFSKTTKFIITAVRAARNRKRGGEKRKMSNLDGEAQTCQQVASINLKHRWGFPFFPKGKYPPPNRKV